MNTPICDFVNKYAKGDFSRLHMPGHKGVAFLGFEEFDITEIVGADSLYHAQGIIRESEDNATRIFGTKRTLYSTEGSSQCIKAGLKLLIDEFRVKHGAKERPVVVASRNAHVAFIYAAALLDFDIKWIWPKDNSDNICSCVVSQESLKTTLMELEKEPACVYITSPDYLGEVADISALSDICHEFGTFLFTDNAHGSYMKFLSKDSGYAHPMDLGSDMCCDSAHKTLPALTGAAYLHIGKSMSDDLTDNAKSAMALMGSTSPSYLTMISLDKCNEYLADSFKSDLKKFIVKLYKVKNRLKALGWSLLDTDPLRLTIDAASAGYTGIELSAQFRENRCECEYADEKYLVLMLTPSNSDVDLERIADCCENCSIKQPLVIGTKKRIVPKVVCSVREAMMMPSKKCTPLEAVGKVCADPLVSCPPAIPLVVSGELITNELAGELARYDVKELRCL